jgi:hypothetical protein
MLRKNGMAPVLDDTVSFVDATAAQPKAARATR